MKNISIIFSISLFLMGFSFLIAPDKALAMTRSPNQPYNSPSYSNSNDYGFNGYDSNSMYNSSNTYGNMGYTNYAFGSGSSYYYPSDYSYNNNYGYNNSYYGGYSNTGCSILTAIIIGCGGGSYSNYYPSYFGYSTYYPSYYDYGYNSNYYGGYY